MYNNFLKNTTFIFCLAAVIAVLSSCAEGVQSGIYEVKGQVTLCECGNDSVRVTLASNEHGAVEISTDNEGNYTFERVWNGAYTVTPHKEGYTFYPASREITITDNSVELVDFDTITSWENIYGSAAKNGEAFSIIQTPDCGYLISGYRDVSVTGTENLDMWLIKTDQAGNIVWEDTRGDASYPDMAYCALIDSDGSIVAGAYNDSVGAGSINMLKYAPTGNEENSWSIDGGWSVLYGTPLLPEKPAYIFQTLDSGYFIGGFSGGTAGNLEDIYGVMTDNSGLNPSIFTYGFENSEKSNAADMIFRDPLYAGGFVIAGESRDSEGAASALLLKRNNLLVGGWSRQYTAVDPLTNEKCFFTSFDSVKEAPDGGYICCGTVKRESAGTRDIYILKTDKDGNELWPLLLDCGADDYNGQIVVVDDSGYAVGFTYMSLTEHRYRVRLARLDAAGNTLWQKDYDAGDDSDVILRSIVRTFDGGFALCCVKTAYTGKRQIFIIKTDRNGDLPFKQESAKK